VQGNRYGVDVQVFYNTEIPILIAFITISILPNSFKRAQNSSENLPRYQEPENVKRKPVFEDLEV